MARQAWSVHTALSRGRAWVHRLVDDQAYDEWEEDTEPATVDDDDPEVPRDLMDQVLSEAAADRSPLVEGVGGKDTAKPN